MSDPAPEASPAQGTPTAAERLAIALGTAVPAEPDDPDGHAGPEGPEDA